jgi:predicted enzyme related to lactoylglutathione lyase
MTAYEFSPFLDIKVSDPVAAANFYIKHFGWTRSESNAHEQTLTFGPLTVFLTQADAPSVKSNVHFEIATSENIQTVKSKLEKAGCTYCSSSMANSYMFTDPFGNNFHVYQR